jgi:hypothetical protein
VLQRSWYQMTGCSVQRKMNKITRMCYCWHNLGTVWLLFYYWTSKLINVLLSPSFPNSHHLRANFPNYKGPDPRYKWVEKSLTCNKHVGFKALSTKQVGFKALVISKSLSSLLIGGVRRPTPRTGQREFEYNW